MPIGFHPIELLTFLFSIFWIWMLVDCLINQRLKGGAKAGWFLLIFFLHWFGALIYFFVGRGRRQSSWRQVSAPSPLYQPQRPLDQQAYQSYQQGYQMSQEPRWRPEQGQEGSRQEAHQYEASEHSQPVPGQSDAYEQPQASYPEQMQ